MENYRRQHWIFLQGLLFFTVSVEPAKSFYHFTSSSNPVYLNRSGIINIPYVWQLKSTTGLSFRTCSDGRLLHQVGANGNSLTLSLSQGSLQVQWTLNKTHVPIKAGKDFTNKVWYYVSLEFSLGNLELKVRKNGQFVYGKIIANNTYNKELWNLRLEGGTPLQVGMNFTGCIMPGQNINFANSNSTAGVVFGDCSILEQQNCQDSDKDFDDCYSYPCKNKGTCVDQYKNYTCQCLPNYSGRNCEQDRSSEGCSIEPCKNNATCVPNANGFTCICQPGFTDQYCMIDINECSTKPCLHGTCIDRINGFECNCTGSGFKGDNCSENINECEDPNLCGNGTCTDIPGSFVCDCPKGFSGSLCNEEINECMSNPCKNGGNCQDLIDNFKCHCVSGFKGIFCEENIDDCGPNSCPWENSFCVDQVNNFTCKCKAGYTGPPESCEDINECASDPCANNATCINLVNAYKCNCAPGFNGDRCTNNINECDLNHCHNNATCVDGINSYTCNCVPGFTGTTCQVNIDDCKNDSCIYGMCTDMVQGFKCECVEGWTGERCDKDFDECSLYPCQNGANCTNLSNDYNCSCAPGYAGKNCSIDIDDCQATPCQNQGKCIDLVNGYRCNCTNDWMGQNCSLVYDACSFAPCQNNGNCSAPLRSHKYSCDCVTGFQGVNCEENINDCLNITCTEGKICYDHINGYECACPRGYHGKNCLEDINECKSSPCQNKGKCINTDGGYHCKCPFEIAKIDTNPPLSFPTGFNGTHCELDINECKIRINNHGICMNGGSCNNDPGSFSCHCDNTGKSGNYYGGRNCELVLDYCKVREQCKNNATCIPTSTLDKYECQCLLGFTGRLCEINIDDCIDQPCQYNGTCVDGINSYKCLCPNGTKGKNCEMNIDECLSNPCQNNGTCTDLLNGYRCNCSDTGFMGNRCQINIDDCKTNPCKNDGTCIDGIKEYSCECHKGFNGSQCEEDINECASNPCVHADECFQRSNQSLYGANSPYPGFSKFSYGKAAGYYCHCVFGFKGPNCEENINDCKDNACQNNATCIDLIGTYNCSCKTGYKGFYCGDDVDECSLNPNPCMQGSNCTNTNGSYICSCLRKARPWYGGKNCSVELTGCKSRPCQNDGRCKPVLVDGIHGYRCECSDGFRGKNCTISTALSFNGQSTLEVTRTPMNQTETFFRFRTTWPEGFLASFPLRDNECVTAEIQKAHLVLGINGSYHRVSTAIVNDATWQSVSILFNKELVLVTLIGTGCQSTVCSKSETLSHPTTGEVSFGKIHGGMHLSTKFPYIGCFEDVKIDGKHLLLNDTMVSGSINVSRGCQRNYQCFPHTCSRRGTCIDLWIRFQCVCYRPFYGKICEQEVTPATFSAEDTNSFVEYNLISLQDSLQTDLNFSFFFTTRRRNSIIVYFVDPDSLRTNNVQPSSFSLLLRDGKVEANLQWCNTLTNNTNKEYANGERHFLQVMITDNRFKLHIDELKLIEQSLQNPCSFNGSKLFVGQVPVDFSRNIRVRRSTNDNLTNNGPIPGFKGVIQDMNLNNVFLMFNNNTSNKVRTSDKILKPMNYSNIFSGQITDDICKSQQPCKANSTCENVFYNDFKCNCTKGFTGKDCSSIDYCYSVTCEEGSKCENAPDGYECFRAATFNESSFINFKARIDLPDPRNLSLEFRTREKKGSLIKAQNLDVGLHFDLELEEGILMVGSGGKIVFNSSIPVNDGDWHSFFLEKNSATNFTVKISNLKQMITMVNSSISIFLNGIANNKTVLSIGNNFDGCVRALRIEKNLLAFDPNSSNSTRSSAYDMISKRNILLGCKGDDVCASWYQKCEHGATCVDEWNKYACTCTVGYKGDYCETNIDDCLQNECKHGATCIDGINSYKCECAPGYDGSRCENNIDECQKKPNCQNNGTCTDLVNGYNCTCTESFTGDKCEFKINQTCATLTCKNGTCTELNYTNHLGITHEVVNCTCDAGFEGKECELEIDFCENITCHNNANCTTNSSRTGFKCLCDNDHEGDYCEKQIDHCATSPCKNGATCKDLVGNFACNCLDGWKGKSCEEDINECENRTEWCLNKGVCKNLPGSFDCNCTGTGYGGPLCQYKGLCTENPCKNNAVCTQNYTARTYKCECTSGFTGQNCTEDIDECVANPCQNGGHCNNKFGTYKCNCSSENFLGTNCHIKNPCSPENDPCMNGANCTYTLIGNNAFPNCTCTSGWQGGICAEKLIAGTGFNYLYLYIGIPLALILLFVIIGVVFFVLSARKKRATSGTYSPRRQEFSGSRVELGNVMKIPPTERLI